MLRNIEVYHKLASSTTLAGLSLKQHKDEIEIGRETGSPEDLGFEESVRFFVSASLNPSISSRRSTRRARGRAFSKEDARGDRRDVLKAFSKWFRARMG